MTRFSASAAVTNGQEFGRRTTYPMYTTRVAVLVPPFAAPVRADAACAAGREAERRTLNADATQLTGGAAAAATRREAGPRVPHPDPAHRSQIEHDASRSIRAMIGGVERRSAFLERVGRRTVPRDRDEPRRQLDARRAAAADGRHAGDDVRAPAGRSRVSAAATRVGARADLVGGHRQHPLHRHGLRRAAGGVLGERRLERGVGQLVDAQRAHQRVRADAVHQRRAADDDAGLRPAEQLVAAEAADVHAGGDRLLTDGSCGVSAIGRPAVRQPRSPSSSRCRDPR